MIELGCILARLTSLQEKWICDALHFGVFFKSFLAISNELEGIMIVVRYLMNEPIIDPSGPSLGSLRIYTRTEEKFSGLPVMGQMVVIWRLQNHQGSAWKMGRALIQQAGNYRVSSFLRADLISKTIYKCFNKGGH